MRKMWLLVEALAQDRVEVARRGQVAPERLFDDDAGAGDAAGSRELLDHGAEERRRDREIVGGLLRRAERLADPLERRGVVVVAVDVAQQAGELVERRGVERAALLEALACPGPQPLEGPAGPSPRRSPAPRGCRASPSPRARGRSSCRRDRPSPRKRPAHRTRVSLIALSLGSRCVLLGRRLLHVSAELEAHRRQQLVLELGLAARAEARVERRGQHRRRHAPRRSRP